jgi:hypothetical protein
MWQVFLQSNVMHASATPDGQGKDQAAVFCVKVKLLVTWAHGPAFPVDTLFRQFSPAARRPLDKPWMSGRCNSVHRRQFSVHDW